MKEKIPKIIHYCWFGGNELPPLAEKCISSWKKYFPDYEIRRWDESNFDVDIIPYTSQANKNRKYAFVSDYARFWILHRFGGIYFDTDVEVIASMDDIIARGSFMGCENKHEAGAAPEKLGVAPGLGIGCPPGHPLYAELLDLYSKLDFKNSEGGQNLKTVVEYTSELLCGKGLRNIPDVQIVDDVYIYPHDYFCPINYKSKKLEITRNTRSIHHYAQSWLPLKAKIFNAVTSVLGIGFSKRCAAVYRRLFH